MFGGCGRSQAIDSPACAVDSLARAAPLPAVIQQLCGTCANIWRGGRWLRGLCCAAAGSRVWLRAATTWRAAAAVWRAAALRWRLPRLRLLSCSCDGLMRVGNSNYLDMASPTLQLWLFVVSALPLSTLCICFKSTLEAPLSCPSPQPYVIAAL